MRLADVAEMRSAPFRQRMDEINAFARQHGLRTFTSWSKIWEYPWVWFHVLDTLEIRGASVLDLGSELSPMPWLLAAHGARVHLIETDPQWEPRWERLRNTLQVEVRWDLVRSEALPIADTQFDLVTSFSVIEHQVDKARAVDEVARVLKPGGVFALSFDLCEAEYGMTFPAWNGTALTRDEFARLVWRHPAFADTTAPRWNEDSMSPFLDWHRTTAPHHNYVVAAARLRKMTHQSSSGC